MTTERLSFDLVELGPRRPGILQRLLAGFARWRECDRQRALLTQLPPYLLRDLGLCDADVWRETHREPWLI